MATNQSFLDGMRASAGFGLNYTRPSATRSADQNNTNSGNPGYSTNMPMPQVNYNAPPMSWQQQVMARQQQGAQLAQDPTNINYIQPMANSMQNYGGPAGAMDPGSVQNAMAAMRGLAAQRNLRAGPGGMSALGVNMGVTPGGGPPQSMFARPRPVRPGGGYTPDQLAAGPSGFRFVRPMAR